MKKLLAILLAALALIEARADPVGNTLIPPVMAGTGSPEGAVVGSVGTVYRRTDGGTSTTFYVKETGTGNTGWIAYGSPSGSGATATATYLVGAADGALTNEIVAGPSPGGELGGTWASPTIADNLSVSGWTLVSPTITGTGTIAASSGAFSGAVTVATEAYSAVGWAGDLSVPTKDALQAKIETIGGGGGSGTVTSIAATSGSAALGISGSPVTVAGTFAFTLDADLTQFAALADPGAHRLVVWNDTTNQYAFGVIGPGLSFDGTTLSATAGGGGTVTATAGALTNNAIMLGAGTVDSKVLGSLGTTTTVLHGNAAGAPTFGVVSLTADVSGILPDANIPSAITRDAEAAAAYAPLTGNNGTGFFSSGQLERARGGTGADTSAFGIGLLGSNGTNNTINVNTANLLSTAIGGETTGSGNVVRSSGATLNDTRKTVDPIGPFTGTMAINFTSLGSWKTGTATGNVTFSGIVLSPGSIGVMSFTQDATGGRTITWPASVVDPEPQIESAPNATTLLTFSSPDGTNIFVTGSMPNVLALDSLTVDALTATTLDGPADDLTLTATGFNGNLATTDDTVQKVAQKVDDLVLGGGSGDITAVGDVASGAAFDGTQGTVLTFNDADGDLTLGTNATANTLVSSHPIDLGATGVRLTGDGDGAMTFASISAGSQENFTINLDDTSNEIVISSSTSVLYFRYSSLNLIATSYIGDAADSADTGVVRASNNQVGIAWEASPTGVDTTLLVDASEIFQFSSGINVTGAGAFSGALTTGGVAVSTTTSTESLQNKDLTNANNTLPCVFQVAASDMTTAITSGTNKAYFRAPYAFTLTEVRVSAFTAPTGSTILVDINESGTTVLSTKLMIDATEKTSTTAATPAVISDSAIADAAEITIDFDQVGSTVAGTGIIVTLKGTY